MNFRVGQKIVCISDDPCPRLGKPPCIKGNIYTVASIYTIPGLFFDQTAISLVEVTFPPEAAGFNPGIFRPAVEPDISIFTAMLSKTPKENRRAARVAARRPRVKEVA